jgi:hypothetical protein
MVIATLPLLVAAAMLACLVANLVSFTGSAGSGADASDVRLLLFMTPAHAALWASHQLPVRLCVCALSTRALLAVDT